MSIRTSEMTVTFKRPFMLSCFDAPHPPGTYLVVMDDQEIDVLSFVAMRRISTNLHTPAIEDESPNRQIFAVDATELNAALWADGRR